MKEANWVKAHNRKTVELSCEYCGDKFKKALSEYRRNQKRGSKNFCSFRCCNLNTREKKYGESHRFVYYVGECKKRAKAKGYDFDLTADYLKSLFDNQDGKCVLTGLNMILNKTTLTKDDTSLFYASLDRIDNNKGYVCGNVHFVCLGVNYMRNRLSLESAVEFIRAIRE